MIPLFDSSLVCSFEIKESVMVLALNLSPVNTINSIIIVVMISSIEDFFIIKIIILINSIIEIISNDTKFSFLFFLV